MSQFCNNLRSTYFSKNLIFFKKVSLILFQCNLPQLYPPLSSSVVAMKITALIPTPEGSDHFIHTELKVFAWPVWWLTGRLAQEAYFNFNYIRAGYVLKTLGGWTKLSETLIN